jgi:hypothetical protein
MEYSKQRPEGWVLRIVRGIWMAAHSQYWIPVRSREHRWEAVQPYERKPTAIYQTYPLQRASSYQWQRLSETMQQNRDCPFDGAYGYR